MGVASGLYIYAGNRLWGKELQMQLILADWSPDARRLLFCTAAGECHIVDAGGNLISQVTLRCKVGICVCRAVISCKQCSCIDNACLQHWADSASDAACCVLVEHLQSSFCDFAVYSCVVHPTARNPSSLQAIFQSVIQ